jgi:hypothetical protein
MSRFRQPVRSTLWVGIGITLGLVLLYLVLCIATNRSPL